MKGIGIYPKGWDDWAQLPAGSEPFEYLFTPILTKAPPLYWIVCGPFDYISALEEYDEEFLDSLYIDIDDLKRRENVEISVPLLRPDFLPKLARYVTTDHSTIIGLSGDEERAKAMAVQLAEIYWYKGEVFRSAFNDFIEKNAYLYFDCEDGVWWEVFSPSSSILDDVRQHVSSNSTLVMEEVTLEDRLPKGGYRCG